ncbi:MAG: replicative DNA helicase, partial [Candidatus Woesebacteria bacterium]|nr:replicative DNA helicase [Candidatus Woesebacteria bacterium]
MADTNQVRVPPHSVEAEESVLGALLLDKDAVIAVAEFLLPEDFYDERHKEIYEAILSLYEERVPVDVLTVTERLKKQKDLKKVGGASYLTNIVNKVPTAAHVEHYGKIVKDKSVKRSLMKAATRLVEMALDEGTSSSILLDRAESEVFSLTQKHLTKAFTSVRDTLAESFDRLDELHKQGEGLRGIATGFTDLDNATAGFQKSNLIILAARPSVGKTSLALTFAQNASVVDKKNVGFFSLEMSKEELVDRLLVSQADIDAWRLKTGKLSEEDFTKLSNAMGILAEAPLYIDDTPALSILEMRTKARRLQVEQGLDLIVVDYLQLARSRNLENRVQEVSEISQGLKNLARELKVPVLALSQLSRGVESRNIKRPQLSDLRESGCLLGDSLITLYPSGERVRIDSLVGKKNFKLVSLNSNLKLKTSIVSRVFPSGKKKVYKLLLKSGREIIASANHKFLKLDNWTRLDELKIGDKLATPRILLVAGNKNISNDKLIVLAHMIGDGCYVKKQPIHYTNADMKLITIVQKAAVSAFSIKPKIVKQENWYHIYLSSAQKLARGIRNPIVKWFDEELGIYGQHSREKVIPNQIFNLNNEKIKLFLKHLWATDGCIKTQIGKKSKVTIYYASGNKELVKQVQHLLLRLGILSKVSSTSKKGYKDIWNVYVQGKVEQFKFLQDIGCVGEKEKEVKKAIKFLKQIIANPNNDVVPKEIWQFVKEVLKNKKITTREFHKKMGWAYSGTQRYGNGISRERLLNIYNVLKEDALKKYAKSDIYWDEIKSIEYVGIKQVYDATVPETSNFVANDIIVHNSIEQDADVVMFLWREDDENNENIMLDIA